MRRFKASLLSDFAILLGLAGVGYFVGGLWGVAGGLVVFAVLLMYAGGDEDHEEH